MDEKLPLVHATLIPHSCNNSFNVIHFQAISSTILHLYHQTPRDIQRPHDISLMSGRLTNVTFRRARIMSSRQTLEYQSCYICTKSYELHFKIHRKINCITYSEIVTQNNDSVFDETHLLAQQHNYSSRFLVRYRETSVDQPWLPPYHRHGHR